MVEPAHPALSITQQCHFVSTSRSSFYYSPTGESPLNLVLVRLIDEAFLECPFYGARQSACHFVLWRGNSLKKESTYEHRQRSSGPTSWKAVRQAICLARVAS
jgi:hypothetical protein